MALGRNTRRLNYIMMFSLFVVQAFDNYCREMKIGLNGINTIKNGLLLFMTLIFLYEIFLLRRKNGEVFDRAFFDETKSIISLAVVFGILSVYFMQKNHGFEMETITGLGRIVIPVIVAYALINVMNIKDIYNLMSILLIVMFVGYIYAIAHRITLKNILAIDFMNSYSPFESSMFSPAAMGFCLFFCYFRKRRMLTVLSVFFTIMTFKRIMVLYALLLLAFGGIAKKMGKMSTWITKVFVLSFIAISMAYIGLMDGTIQDFVFRYTGLGINSFTMGRAFFMRTILRDFKSLGFMTSTVGYRSMEMDIPMVYVEMGILAVIALIYFMSKLIKNNWYNFLIVLFCLLELLTSHWLDIVYFWIVAYLTIGCVSYKSETTCIRHIPKVHFR